MRFRWYQPLMVVVLLASWATCFPATFVIDNLTDEPVEGECSLREALLSINTRTAVGSCPTGTGNDRLELTRGAVYQLSRQLQLGGMTETVLDDVDDGEDATPKPVAPRVRFVSADPDDPFSRGDEEGVERPVIQAAAGARVLCIMPGAEAVIEAIDLRGHPDQQGSILPVTAPELPDDPDLDICGAEPDGGIIHSSGRLSINGFPVISGGKARHGGAFFINFGNNVTLESVTLQDNEAQGNGGAIATGTSFSGKLSAIRFFIADNSAAGAGGALHLLGSSVRLDATNGTITGNTSASGGTGIHIDSDASQVFMNNVTVAANTGAGGARAGFYLGAAGPSDQIRNSVLVGNTPADVYIDNKRGGARPSGCFAKGDNRLLAAYVITGPGCSGLDIQAVAQPLNDGVSTSADMSVFLGYVEEQIQPCPAGGPCQPVPAELLDARLPGYLPNFNRLEIGPSLFDAGSPDTEVTFACDSADQRGGSRADRCDIGALEFGRAEGFGDFFRVTKGKGESAVLDVVASDLKDTSIDCTLLEEPENCILIVQPSTRPDVEIVVELEDGYPSLRYTMQRPFDGYDFFSYRIAREAFIGTTFGDRDVGARITIESRPSSGMTKKKNIDDFVGGFSFAGILFLILAGVLRRLSTVAPGLVLLLLLPASVLAADIDVTNVEDRVPYQPVQGQCTLREAVVSSIDKLPSDTFCAPGQTGEDTIFLPEGVIRLRDTIETGRNNRVVLVGQGVDKTIIEPACVDDLEDPDTGECLEGHLPVRLFAADSSIAFRSLTLRHGTAEEGRGGIVLAGQNLAMFNVKVEGARAREGGAIFLDFNDDERHSVDIIRTYFRNNQADANGGVLSMFAQTQRHDIQVFDSTFEANRAPNGSGGVFDVNLPAGGIFTVANSTFLANESASSGSVFDLRDLTTGSSANLISNTILGNIGGIGPIDAGRSGAVSVSNSIIVGLPMVCSSEGGRFSNFSYNLVSGNDSSCRASSESGTKYNANIGLVTAALSNGLLDGEILQFEEEEVLQNYVPPHLPVTDVRFADIVDSANPGDPATGTGSVTFCRVEDLRGAPRTAGGVCDKGAYELQVTTAIAVQSTNAGRGSRTVALDVGGNDIVGDDMKIRTGRLSVYRLTGHAEFEDTAGSAKVIRRKNDDDEDIFYLTEEERNDPNNACGTGRNFTTDARVDEEGKVTVLSSSTSTNSGADDDDCGVLYIAPPLACESLPFTDRFEYEIFSQSVSVDASGEEIWGAATATSRALVTVNINNVAPVVPSEAVEYKMTPGDSLLINLDEDTFYDEDGTIQSFEVPESFLPDFTVTDVDPDDETRKVIIGVGLILDQDERTVLYDHASTFQTFTDRFTIRFEDDCGATSEAEFVIRFPHASASGGELLKGTSGTPSLVMWLGVLLLVRRRQAG